MQDMSHYAYAVEILILHTMTIAHCSFAVLM